MNQFIGEICWNEGFNGVNVLKELEKDPSVSEAME